MRVVNLLLLLLSLSSSATSPAATYAQAKPAARAIAALAVVDTAIARMGGLASLRAIHTVRYDMVTQWLATSFW